MLSHFKGHAMVGLGSREYEIVNLDSLKCKTITVGHNW